MVLAREPFSRFTTPETLNGTGNLHTHAKYKLHTRQIQAAPTRDRDMQRSSLLGARAIFMAIYINIEMRYIVMYIKTDVR